VGRFGDENNEAKEKIGLGEEKVGLLFSLFSKTKTKPLFI
jgi:hypothetical protein